MVPLRKITRSVIGAPGRHRKMISTQSLAWCPVDSDYSFLRTQPLYMTGESCLLDSNNRIHLQAKYTGSCRVGPRYFRWDSINNYFTPISLQQLSRIVAEDLRSSNEAYFCPICWDWQV